MKEIKPLVIKVEKSSAGQKPAMIDADTHATLKELSIKTGIPMTQLIRLFTRFAMEHLVVEGLEDEGEARRIGM